MTWVFSLSSPISASFEVSIVQSCKQRQKSMYTETERSTPKCPWSLISVAKAYKLKIISKTILYLRRRRIFLFEKKENTCMRKKNTCMRKKWHWDTCQLHREFYSIKPNQGFHRILISLHKLKRTDIILNCYKNIPQIVISEKLLN